MRVGFESGLVAGEKERRIKGKGKYKKAWLWVEGWMARLRRVVIWLRSVDMGLIGREFDGV